MEKRVGNNSITFSELNGKCQLDFIDYQNQANGKYKFELVYQW